MNLDNKLCVKISQEQYCFCGNVEEVASFLKSEKDYFLTEVEYKAINYIMSSILPVGKATEKRGRFLLVVTDMGQLGEFSENEPLPEGWRKLATIYADAFTDRSNPVARFQLNTFGEPIILDMSRYRSEESMSFRIAEFAWKQQSAALINPDVPYVMSDISQLKGGDRSSLAAQNFYVMKIGEDCFRVSSEEDINFVLTQLIQGRLSKEWHRFFDVLFQHLSDFPKGKFFHTNCDIYVDNNKFFYVGGNGCVSSRRLRKCGILYPAYFTGAPGPLMRMNLGAIEDVILEIYLFRPLNDGSIPEK